MNAQTIKMSGILLGCGIVTAVPGWAMLNGATGESGNDTTHDAVMSATVPSGGRTSAHPNGKPDADLPKPVVDLVPGRVALVVTDPQNDFLSEDGVAWGAVGQSVIANDTVAHIDELFAAAHATGVPVFISPHYYYEHDHRWHFEGALEALMHDISMFDRKHALTLDGFAGSGADWLSQYKPYIDHPNTTIVSPHKVYGPESNDLVLQLRKRGIDQVILAGMSANLCTEAHMRELIEQGFEVIVVADATAAAVLPEYDGYEAAFINFRFIANGVWSTNTAVERMQTLAMEQAQSAHH